MSRTPNCASANRGRQLRMKQQRIRFCTSRDDIRIALATAGEGPPLVRINNWFTHLELDWDNPVWRHWSEALAERRTLIRYDPRGSGLSDRDVADLSLDALVSDLKAVVDALKLRRFPLIGLCQGGVIAVRLCGAPSGARKSPGPLRQLPPWRVRGRGPRATRKAGAGVFTGDRAWLGQKSRRVSRNVRPSADARSRRARAQVDQRIAAPERLAGNRLRPVEFLQCLRHSRRGVAGHCAHAGLPCA